MLNDTLKAFACIARHTSFTRAAAELEVSPSALSQSISQLEARLETRLLHRTTRRVGLTEAGREFLQRIAPALAEIDEAVEQLHRHGGSPSGTLRLTLPRIAGPQLLEPLLGDFARAHPRINLELLVEDTLTDLVSRGFDAGIRLGEALEQDMVAVPVSGPLRWLLVANPKYLARRGAPGHPRELLQHDCVRYRYTGSGVVERWEFERRGHRFDIAVDGPVTTNDNDLMLRAVLDGLGIGLLLEQTVCEHLESGRLQSLLECWCPPSPGFYLYYPSRRHLPAKLRVFIDFLRQRERKLR
ncbi:LysR family transcriptional regulator [Microbulbifer halophilus]|uniref:LysR family transcriptional regulator n=1 Tax=Microbulbifer halophilus TaxID=453963 RepID=A0ABW5E6V9_9GAMM|nr:LysR family transcriptional regulator [Microbulbifer halophilus]MCW8125839.1 LysR family transcriptional regulator [Microbulbifer halophilus]